ncbi:temperature dependent protein affecting M2 dsRNA replication-domain-containing protein [Lipomyces arxii]|uniref:temperature dependent protein affecting M2 dsRNA replication-domain-containing protein n=1 Tax=Lipomyces arxii TaxID=56418 RepID=UPI0034CFBFE4
MTVRLLDAFIYERKQSRSLPLTVLKDTVLGIDAEYFFLQQLSPSGKKEPLFHALGGIPFAVKAILDNFLNAMQAAGVKPIFVFRGVQIYKNDQMFTRSDLQHQKRLEAWDSYDRSKGDIAVSIFNEIDPIPVAEIARYAMKVLQEKNVAFSVAPYCSWAQLVYLLKHENKFIDSIYGPTEALLYDIDRLIISMDIVQGGFSWVSKKALLSELGGLGNDQFLDLCVLIGLDFSSPFPILEQPHMNGLMIIRAARELLRNYVSGYGAVMAYSEHPIVKDTNYIDTYRRAYCAVKYHIVMTDKGTLHPITLENAPSDIHEFVSQRLPPELYFYMAQGIVGPEILDALTSGRLVELVPLDGGESVEYHTFLSDLQAMKSQQLSLLTEPLHRFYQAKRVYTVNWYDRAAEHDIAHRLSPTTYETVNTWYVYKEILEPRLGDKKTAVDLDFAITSLIDGQFAEKTILAKDLERAFTTQNEILASTYWRFLQLRAFVSPDHKLTPWGDALALGLKSTGYDDVFADTLLIALELIRFNVLTAKTYTPSYSGLPIRGTDAEKEYILLISRVASLLPISHMAIGFSGPLSRNLLSFNSFVHKYSQSARTLLETTLFSLLANGDADRLSLTNSDWVALGVSLPYVTSPNCGLGIAMKTYLDELCSKENPTDPAEREKMKEELKKLFAHTLHVVADLEQAFRLWDSVVFAVKVLTTHGAINTAEAEAFLDADAWVMERR